MILKTCPDHYYHETVTYKDTKIIPELPICQIPHKVALLKDRGSLKPVSIIVYNKYQHEYLGIKTDDRLSSDTGGRGFKYMLTIHDYFVLIDQNLSLWSNNFSFSL